jgi:hypothetical protein
MLLGIDKSHMEHTVFWKVTIYLTIVSDITIDVYLSLPQLTTPFPNKKTYLDVDH